MTTLVRRFSLAWIGLSLAASTLLAPARAADSSPFLGQWALTIPGGGAGWLEITKQQGYYDGSILWGGGSVLPVASVFFLEDALYVVRINEVKRRDASGTVVRTQQFPEAIVAHVDGDNLRLVQVTPNPNGENAHRAEFSGQRIPPLPDRPDLSAVKFGESIALFNGKDLTGWRLIDSGSVNGWNVQAGTLINRPVQKEGQPHKNYGNLRTDKEFEDFNLKLEVNVPKGGNSGVYLRGIYEVQVADSYGKPVDSHGMGGVYSRLTPTTNPTRPPGEWQTLDITLVDRHVTVLLNGTKILDNQPLAGCTGGALWSDQFRPGPIYLQGDHEAVDYRNLVLRPVRK